MRKMAQLLPGKKGIRRACSSSSFSTQCPSIQRLTNKLLTQFTSWMVLPKRTLCYQCILLDCPNLHLHHSSPIHFLTMLCCRWCPTHMPCCWPMVIQETHHTSQTNRSPTRLWVCRCQHPNPNMQSCQRTAQIVKSVLEVSLHQYMAVNLPKLWHLVFVFMVDILANEKGETFHADTEMPWPEFWDHVVRLLGDPEKVQLSGRIAGKGKWGVLNSVDGLIAMMQRIAQKANNTRTKLVTLEVKNTAVSTFNCHMKGKATHLVQ